MRLFVALELPERQADGLDAIQCELAEICSAGRLYTRDNLHLTLAFLGEVPEEWDAELHSALIAAAQDQMPFSISFASLGVFGERMPWPVVWLGIAENDALRRLQRQIERCLLAVGFAVTERPFRPHVTLARNVPVPLERLRSVETSNVSAVQVSSFALMESRSEGGRRVYRARERFYLPTQPKTVDAVD